MKKRTCTSTRTAKRSKRVAQQLATMQSLECKKTGWQQTRKRRTVEEMKKDEEEQTAQDYSIIIQNPPFDANDPEEW